MNMQHRHYYYLSAVFSVVAVSVMPSVAFAAVLQGKTTENVAVPVVRPTPPVQNAEKTILPAEGEGVAAPLVVRVVKENAEKLINVLLQRFDAFEARVKASNQLSDGAKEELLENIAADRVFVQEQSQKIQSATTPQEMRAVIRDVLEYLRNRRAQLRQHRDEVRAQFANYVTKLQEQSERMVEKLNTVIAKLDAKGFETSSVKIALQEYEAAVSALAQLDVVEKPEEVGPAIAKMRTTFRAVVQALQEVLAARQ